MSRLGYNLALRSERQKPPDQMKSTFARVFWRTLTLLLGVVQADAVLFAAEPARFHVEGQIAIWSAEAPRGEPAPNPRGAFNFSVSVDGERWIIRTQPHQFLTNSANCPTEYYEAATDGTNVYYLDMFNRGYDKAHGQLEALQKLQEQEEVLLKAKAPAETVAKVSNLITLIEKDRANPAKEIQNEAAGSIFLGTVPEIRLHNLIAPLWLAFCSTHQIAKSNVALVPAVLESLPGNTNPLSILLMKADCAFSEVAPYLPISIEFLNDGKYYVRSRNGSSGGHPRTIPSPKRRPAVTGEYKVLASQDYEGLRCPQKFTFKRYAFRSTGQGISAAEQFVIEGSTFRATTNVPATDFMPRLKVVTAVADRRFPEAAHGSIPFIIKNGEWPGQAQVRASEDQKNTSVN